MSNPNTFVVQNIDIDNGYVTVTASCPTNDVTNIMKGDTLKPSLRADDPMVVSKRDNVVMNGAIHLLVEHMSKGPFAVDEVFHEGPALFDNEDRFVCRLPILVNSTHDKAILAGKTKVTAEELELLRTIMVNRAILCKAHTMFELLVEFEYGYVRPGHGSPHGLRDKVRDVLKQIARGALLI
jgi:GH43 family beta-xylosidase